MQAFTEENGQKCAQHGKQRNPQQHRQCQNRRRNQKVRGRDVEKPGNAECGQRSDQAGNQRRVIEKPDADDRHGEDGCGQRSPEQGGEESRHAGDRCGAQVAVVQMQDIPNVKPDGPAHLQGGAFASGGTAAQVCEQRGEENRRDQVQLQPLAGLNLADDVVGAVPLNAEKHINGDNDRPHSRQHPEKPVVPCAPGGDGVNPKVERRTEQPAENADNPGNQDPLGERADIDQKM